MSNDKLTVTLTGRAPVTITKENWPKIASANGYNGEHQCQANHEWWVNVRQHADGRALVYAADERGHGGMALTWREKRAGELLAANDDIPAAISRVCEAIGHPDLSAECIADLPAVTLD